MKDALTLKFIEKAAAVHGNKYNYELVEHRGARVKVSILCKKHGEFQQRMDSHLSGAGCKKCVADMIRTETTSTTEEYIDKLKAIYQDRLLFDKTIFVRSKANVTVTCPEHGDITGTAHLLLMGHGCKVCNRNKRKLPLSTFILKSNAVHFNKYDYSCTQDFERNSDKVDIGCPIHGAFTQDVQSHLSGSGCPKCGYESTVAPKRIKTDEFIKRASETHKGKYDYSLVELNGASNRVQIICPTHGVFDQVASTHLSGRGCRFCRNDATTYNMVSKYQDNEALGNQLGTLYIAKFSDGVESFLKVGISSDMKKRLKRYRQFSKMYSCEIIKTVEMTNLSSAKKERHILKILRQEGFKYKPLKKLSGRSECLSNTALIRLIEMVEE